MRSANTPTSAPPLPSFGVFTDAHYSETNYGDRNCTDALDKLRACAETMNARGVPLAFFLGDAIDTGGSREAELGYMAAFRHALSALRAELHVLVGNHDLITLSKADFLANHGGTCAKPWYAFDCAGVRFVLLDGNCHENGRDFSEANFQWDKAWVSAEQVDWLAGQLASAGNRPALVLCHENLDDRDYYGAPDPHVLQNAAELRAVIEKAGNVAAVLQGHYHPGIRTMCGRIPCIGFTGMVEGPGLDNNAFAIVTLLEGGGIEVEGFGRQKSFLIGGRTQSSGLGVS